VFSVYTALQAMLPAAGNKTLISVCQNDFHLSHTTVIVAGCEEWKTYFMDVLEVYMNM
jgi:hypothetical protein